MLLEASGECCVPLALEGARGKQANTLRPELIAQSQLDSSRSTCVCEHVLVQGGATRGREWSAVHLCFKELMIQIEKWKCGVALANLQESNLVRFVASEQR